ncbi:YbaK/EbsC family protein [Actinomadura fulvescens]|uniref:YbaK/aminoacyl-tRNA synthetase-associated domain-containing protein n=1 Tax=Actinomadura fulvescens TaxID=46160 RepID=A0ABN3Q6B5_9ACTN
MKDALTIHRALLERETLHEIVRLPIAIAHADELPKALGLPAGRCLVTRVYACNDVHRGQRFLAGVIVPAGVRPPAEQIRLAVGARLIRPARPDLVNTVTDYAAGLVCPLLLPDSMPLLIGEHTIGELPVDDVVYTATGEASTALGIRALDLFALSGAKPVDLSSARAAGERPVQQVGEQAGKRAGKDAETQGGRHAGKDAGAQAGERTAATTTGRRTPLSFPRIRHGLR